MAMKYCSNQVPDLLISTETEPKLFGSSDTFTGVLNTY
uniref:Uncharacterized protein n=1 Tax=Arundo donax TaxID=35708 RepID=A0A0A9ANN2_ARUDO